VKLLLLAVSKKSIAESLVMGVIIASTLIGLTYFTSITIAGHTTSSLSQSSIATQSTKLVSTRTLGNTITASSSSGTQSAILAQSSTSSSQTASSQTTSSESASTTSSSALQSVTPTTTSTTITTTITTVTSATSTSNSQPPILGLISTLGVTLNGQFAFDPSNGIIYATGNDSIVEINSTSNQIVGSIPLIQNATDIAFDQANNELYISTTYPVSAQSEPGAGVMAFRVRGNLTSVIFNETGFGGIAGDIVVVPASNNIYLETQNFVQGAFLPSQIENLIALDSSQDNRVVANFTVESSSPALAMGPIVFDPVNGLIYGISRSIGEDGGGGALYFAVNTTTNQVLPNLQQGEPNFPANFAINSQNGLAYVSPNYYCAVMGAYSCYKYPADNLSIVNGTRIVGQIPISTNPNSTLGSLTYDSQNSKIYLVNGTISNQVETANLTTINANTDLITSVTGLPGPAQGLYLDPTNNDLYIAISGDVYVVSTAAS
jgi:hypothetical protein